MGAGAGDHGAGVVDAGVLHDSGEQRGKYFRIVTAAAADLDQLWSNNVGCGNGSHCDSETSRGSPRFMAAIKP